MEWVVQIHCYEGVANHSGPEPCAGIREYVGEASARGHIGQPLSRVNHIYFRLPTPCSLRKAKWTCFHPWAVLDIFSCYVVGWMVATRARAETAAKQHITPGTFALHADRGTRMRSRTVAQLLVDHRIAITHSNPVPNPEVPARLPRALWFDRRCARPLSTLLCLVPHRTLPQRHRLHDTRNRLLRPCRRCPKQCATALDAAFACHPVRFKGYLPTTTGPTDRGVDQPAGKGAIRTQIHPRSHRNFFTFGVSLLLTHAVEV